MRVLLSGYYGFGNHGDEALLAGLIRGLREHGHEPIVLSADPAATRRLHGVSAHARTTGLVPALVASDALVSGGGGLLQDATSGRSLGYYLAVIRLARLFGKPTIVYGQSIGPLSEGGRRWVGYALRGIPIAVRDRPSQELLAGLGFDSTRTADAALLLGTPDAREPNNRSGPVVLVPRAGYPKHTASLVEVARRLSADGVDVRCVALHAQQDAADADAIQRAATGEPAVLTTDFRESFRWMAHARMVVSARLHALVFAAATHVPHIGLVYDPKVAGFLEDSGGLAFSAPFDTDAIYGAVREPRFADDERIRRLVARSRHGMQWLHDRLREAHDGAE